VETEHAFQAVYGHDAVLQTSPEMGRGAKYWGAHPVTEAEVGGFISVDRLSGVEKAIAT
jgi:hypothetical protein